MNDQHWQAIEDALVDKRKRLKDDNPHTFVSGWRKEALDEIEAALAFVREMRQGVQPYSHRNGEAESPTVEGWYSIQHRQAWNWDGSKFVFVEMEADGACVYFAGQDDAISPGNMDDAIRWYGPIEPSWTPQPKESDSEST